MVQFRLSFRRLHTSPVGVFVTKDEAEEALTQARDRDPGAGGRNDRYWIEAVPIAV
jgi:hypothetical protein